MGATKQAMFDQWDADDRRKTALIQLAAEGNEEAGNDLWREFGLIVDPAGELEPEFYTAYIEALEKDD